MYTKTNHLSIRYRIKDFVYGVDKEYDAFSISIPVEREVSNRDVIGRKSIFLRVPERSFCNKLDLFILTLYS